MEHYRQTYSISEQQLIRVSLDLLDKSADVTKITNGFMDIYRTVGKLNLQEIERMLRQNSGRTFLLGLELDPTGQLSTWLPDANRTFPYYLWTEVNGEQRALAKMEQEKLTYQQNFDRLAETGILVPKAGTQLARSAKAHLN